MKISFPKNIKKIKSTLCLVGLILLGFFILKNFNLIEGMGTQRERPSTPPAGPRPGAPPAPPAGPRPGAPPAPPTGPRPESEEEGDDYGDGSYTVHVNIEAPKMGKLAPVAAAE